MYLNSPISKISPVSRFSIIEVIDVVVVFVVALVFVFEKAVDDRKVDRMILQGHQAYRCQGLRRKQNIDVREKHLKVNVHYKFTFG